MGNLFAAIACLALAFVGVALLAAVFLEPKHGDMTAMLALSIGGAMTTCGLGGVYASFKGDDT